MRRSIAASGTIWESLMLASLFLILASSEAQAQTSNASADISAMLRKHDEAMNRQDLDGVLALFAPGPKTVVLGTGPGERYQGKDEIRVAYTEFFKDFDKGTLTHNCYWREGAGSGNLAWGAAMCKLADSLGDKKREYEINVTAVMEKVGGKWYFRMLHYSNLTAAPAASQ